MLFVLDIKQQLLWDGHIPIAYNLVLKQNLCESAVATADANDCGGEWLL